MACDWIKMRTDLYRHPKVCAMADFLMKKDGKLATFISQNCQRDMTVTRNVMRNVTVGALVTVWGVMRHRGTRENNDLKLHGMSSAIINDIADLPGLDDAMAQVGWVVEDGEWLIFPRFFEEMNIEPGMDAKEKNAERQRRYREKLAEKSHGNSNGNRNVTVTSQCSAREEKSRVEYIQDISQAEPSSLAQSSNGHGNKKPRLSDVEWFESLKSKLPGIDMESQRRKAEIWLLAHPGRKFTRKFFTNWVLRIDQPLELINGKSTKYNQI
jgi:hypothetical protein